MHTPGDWHVGTGKATAIVYAADGYAVANAVTHHGRRSDAETEGNARLMAAGPRLLAALDRCQHYLGGPWCAPEDVIEQVRAAIAAAK